MAHSHQASEPSGRVAYTPAERALLLDLARRALLEKASGRTFEPESDGISEMLRRVQACFVTLFNAGELRGCVGQVHPQLPLYQAVAKHACSAGFNDLRFEPVILAEVAQIEIEISVLSPAVPLHGTPEEILEQLRPHTDGVIIEQTGKLVTFLPQVWEQIPDKEEFLRRLCHKAGWDEESWKSANVTLSVYEVESFKSQDRSDAASQSSR